MMGPVGAGHARPARAPLGWIADGKTVSAAEARPVRRFSSSVDGFNSDKYRRFLSGVSPASEASGDILRGWPEGLARRIIHATHKFPPAGASGRRQFAC